MYFTLKNEKSIFFVIIQGTCKYLLVWEKLTNPIIEKSTEREREDRILAVIYFSPQDKHFSSKKKIKINGSQWFWRKINSILCKLLYRVIPEKAAQEKKEERFVCLVLPKAADLCGSHVWMRFVQWPCTVLPPSSSRPWLHLKLGSQQDHVLRSSEGTTPLPSSLSHDLTVTINSGEEAVFETQISKSQQCRGEWVKHFFYVEVTEGERVAVMRTFSLCSR